MNRQAEFLRARTRFFSCMSCSAGSICPGLAARLRHLHTAELAVLRNSDLNSERAAQTSGSANAQGKCAQHSQVCALSRSADFSWTAAEQQKIEPPAFLSAKVLVLLQCLACVLPQLSEVEHLESWQMIVLPTTATAEACGRCGHVC